MKRTVFLSVALGTALLLSTTALAHGGCHGGGRHRSGAAVCQVAYCANTEHSHYVGGQLHDYADCVVEGHCHNIGGCVCGYHPAV